MLATKSHLWFLKHFIVKEMKSTIQIKPTVQWIVLSRGSFPGFDNHPIVRKDVNTAGSWVKFLSTIFLQFSLSLRLFQKKKRKKERGGVGELLFLWDLLSGRRPGHQSPFFLPASSPSRKRLEEFIEILPRDPQKPGEWPEQKHFKGLDSSEKGRLALNWGNAYTADSSLHDSWEGTEDTGATRQGQRGKAVPLCSLGGEKRLSCRILGPSPRQKRSP